MGNLINKIANIIKFIDTKLKKNNNSLIPFLKNPITYISSTNYGDHYKFGIKIFLDNKFFGIGLKNYRLIAGNYHGEEGKRIIEDQLGH